jgi:hypothetical protein
MSGVERDHGHNESCVSVASARQGSHLVLLLSPDAISPHKVSTSAALERAQVPERIDHRSLAAQGIGREPEPKIGAAAQAMEWREALERNAERALQASVPEVSMGVDD